MKILHLCKKYPKALGGDAIVVANLQKQQQAAGHEVVIVTSNCDEIANGDHVYKVGLKDTPAKLDEITMTRMVSLVILFFAMFAILRKERPNVIHTHSIDMAFFASFAARFYHIPMVHTFHIVTFYDPDQSVLRRKTELWFAKKAKLRNATAPNIYDVKKLQEAGLERTTLLPNGVDLTFWETNHHTRVDRVFEFLAIGRLERQKGYEYLIRAAVLLVDMELEAFRITIVGEGSQAATLDTLAHKLHVENIIKRVGRKTPEEVRELLAEANAVVLPSLYETTPLTMLEAWSAAVPVIVTPVGIVHDAPADFDAAYIVPPKDPQSLMQAMGRCMIDIPSRLAVAAKGHEEVKKYAWPAIAQTAEAIYRGTL